MARSGFVWVGTLVLASAACAGHARSAQAPSKATNATAASASSTGNDMNANAQGVVSPPVTGERVVNGRVERIDRANDVVVSGTESVGLAFDTFKIDQGTQVTVNGQQASAADVQPGDDVRASFSGTDADPHLDRLEVTSAGK